MTGVLEVDGRVTFAIASTGLADAVFLRVVEQGVQLFHACRFLFIRPGLLLSCV